MFQTNCFHLQKPYLDYFHPISSLTRISTSFLFTLTAPLDLFSFLQLLSHVAFSLSTTHNYSRSLKFAPPIHSEGGVSFITSYLLLNLYQEGNDKVTSIISAFLAATQSPCD